MQRPSPRSSANRILAAEDGDFRLPTQDQLVDEFGVSYPSIREAIRILETEGLVTVTRGNVGGAAAHRPNESSAAYALGLALQGARVSLRDLAEGLQRLEPLCAAECALRRDRVATIVPALSENIDKLTGLLSDGVKFTHTAREFHDLIVAHTPNATLRYVVASLVALWSAQEEAWAESLTRQGDYFSDSDARAAIRTHERIRDEISNGRASDAERIARAHLAATQALFLSRFPDGVINATSTRARQAITSIRSQR